MYFMFLKLILGNIFYLDGYCVLEMKKKTNVLYRKKVIYQLHFRMLEKTIVFQDNVIVRFLDGTEVECIIK